MTCTRPSHNNQYKTRSLFTTNSKQYLQLQNFEKYDHIYDAQLNFVIVINRKTKDLKGVFDYAELTNYLEVNQYYEYISRVKLIQTAFLNSQRNDL